MTGSILPVARPLGEVDGVLLERLVGALGVGRGDLPVAAHRAERRQQRVAGGAGTGEHAARLAARTRRDRPAGARWTRTRRRGRWPARRAALMAREQLTGRRGRGDGRAADAGQPASAASALARTSAGSAPTAVSSGPAMPSVCSSSATSRCVGPTSGLPARWAACTAAEIACWVLVVGLKLSIPASSCVKTLGPERPSVRDNVREVEPVPLRLRRPVRARLERVALKNSRRSAPPTTRYGRRRTLLCSYGVPTPVARRCASIGFAMPVAPPSRIRPDRSCRTGADAR